MIEIKKALPSDAQTLADLGKTTFIETFAKDNRKEDIELFCTETYSANKQLAEIIDPERQIELAWSGDHAAGFLHMVKSKPDPCIEGLKPIEILRLYVDARWHGKAVGAALMERAIQIARNDGCDTLWLGVWERNLRAQAFYAKYGFTTVGKHIFRVGADEQIDLILARAVSA